MSNETKEKIVKEVSEAIYQAYPYLWEKFGEHGRIKTEEDNYHHLDHLETTYELRDITVFLDYTKWLENVLTSRNVGTYLIIDNFERLVKAIPGKVDKEREQAFLMYLQQAIQLLKNS
ncbi:hypothetical protein ACFPU1_00320 [Thalassorhabdus alkalitolerans]|uniref:Uncharacterized protein n=1 Tax=Thalassorhabdus alkalitolerans TaxID=2282697 RepID=A0ABW0YHS2_9BACI